MAHGKRLKLKAGEIRALVGDAGHLQASIYFDEEEDAATAMHIAQSIAATKTP